MLQEEGADADMAAADTAGAVTEGNLLQFMLNFHD